MGSDRAVIRGWVVPAHQAVGDAHRIAHVAAHNGSVRYAAIAASINWVTGGQPGPLTERTEPVTRELAEAEWVQAGSVELGLPTPEPLPAPAAEPVTDDRRWATSVGLALGWLLGVHARPPLPIPRRLPDGSAPTAEQLYQEAREARPHADWSMPELRVHGMPPATPLPIASTTPRLGETVTSIGFAGLNITEADGIEFLQDSRLHPVNTSGTITARQFRQGVAVYQVSATFDHGMSGGPTINSRGEGYGVNSQMTVPFFGQNFNVITDTGMLREFLGHDEPESPQITPTVDASLQISAQLGRDPATATDLSTGWIGPIWGLVGVCLGGLAAWRSRRFVKAGDDRALSWRRLPASGSARA